MVSMPFLYGMLLVISPSMAHLQEETKLMI